MGIAGKVGIHCLSHLLHNCYHQPAFLICASLEATLQSRLLYHVGMGLESHRDQMGKDCGSLNVL